MTKQLSEGLLAFLKIVSELRRPTCPGSGDGDELRALEKQIVPLYEAEFGSTSGVNLERGGGALGG